MERRILRRRGEELKNEVEDEVEGKEEEKNKMWGMRIEERGKE